MKSLLAYILEAAMPRKDYIASIDGVADKVLEHVLLIHMYQDAQDIEHWKKEIAALLGRLFHDIKSGDSYSKRKIIVTKYLLGDPFTSLKHDASIIREIDAIDFDKDSYTLPRSSAYIWQQIKPHVLALYDQMIDAIARKDKLDLKKLLKAYQPSAY